MVCTIRQFVKTFSLAKSFHTFKNAPDDKECRTLRSATKGFALWKPTNFCVQKFDKKLLFSPLAAYLCAVGEQRAGSACRAIAVRWNCHLAQNQSAKLLWYFLRKYRKGHAFRRVLLKSSKLILR